MDFEAFKNRINERNKAKLENAAKITDSKYQKENFGADAGGPNVKNNKNGGKDAGYKYGQGNGAAANKKGAGASNAYLPPSKEYLPASKEYLPPSNTYLPAKGYRPPQTYLPPVGFKPPSRDYN